MSTITSPTSTPLERRSAESSARGPLATLVAVLEQTAAVVRSLSAEQYGRKPVGVVKGSVGGHVRHCLDHIECLLSGAERGEIDYDHRLRDARIETDPGAALDRIADVERRLVVFATRVHGAPLQLVGLFARDAPACRVETTVGRELLFVLSHTIHHQALIAVLVTLLGHDLPEYFGYAPATIAHERQTPCAR